MTINLHFHIDNVHVHTTDDKTLKQLVEKVNSLHSKIHKMNQDLEQIKADLTEANTTLGKVKADVTLLHSKVDSIADQPTPEEWAEVKSLAAGLKTALKEVDDQTAEEVTTGPTP